MTAVAVEIQRACRVPGEPGDAAITLWVERAVARFRDAAELTIRICDAAEGAALNERYRHRQGPTNVLSFPAEGLEEIAPDLLGDLVICAPVAVAEAEAQGKALHAHWAHLTIHGTLHLLGLDHLAEAEALAMEALERELVTGLGYADPYAGEQAP
ncbi:MAG: rRNA maturation RNase YbeY [Gammaproteobacteria bacterium]|nr:rRNA maturation RNase YbeY [Gammaproteobacteria bacterium]MBI5617500.1 rRNA maturation RNase YbeY [Gammaproteobacteria bacterium]